MSNYRVTVKQTQLVHFVVEAESEERAREMFEGGEIDRAACYAGEDCSADNHETIISIQEWEA
jgi:hypothetical protein